MSRPYRPSNGTEGAGFMALFCDRCEKDHHYQTTEEPGTGCPILANTFVYDVTDPEYPKEWVQNDDGLTDPRCMAFEETLTEEKRAERKLAEDHKAAEAAGQRPLFEHG